MKASLDSHTAIIPRSHAELLWTMRETIEKAHKEPDNLLSQKYRHGMTHKEVKAEHADYVKGGRFEKLWGVYDNKLRALVTGNKLAGRHVVHDETHFFPLCLDENGMIDHSRCLNCQL